MMDEIKVIKDIPFLTEDREEKMDAYLPSAAFAGPHPAILLIHGGGWRLLDKASPREVNIGTTLAKAGYAVFSINYLLNEGQRDAQGKFQLTRVAWPQNFYDCKNALRFLRAHADRYEIDTTRIAAMGGSAGGHLAMLLGATAHHKGFNQQGLYTDQSNEVACILTLYGDFDLRGRSSSPVAGDCPETTALNSENASPITWIDEKTPPMFISHGTADATVSVERSRLLARHLQSLQLTYWYVEIANAGHSYDLHPEQMNLEPVVLSFLEKHLGQPVKG